uniref:Secreted protein n=1 Tax=Oryctolagus cuniculus TaxID=9986 RepID=A0A5F9CCR6_RABIT
MQATRQSDGARLGLGLLLLALLLHRRIYSNQTTVVTVSSNSSQNALTAPSPTNVTARAAGNALQSTTASLVSAKSHSLFYISTVKRLSPGPGAMV